MKEATLNDDQWNVTGDYALNVSSKASPRGMTMQSSLQASSTGNPLRNSTKSMGKLALRSSTSKGLLRAPSFKELTMNEDTGESYVLCHNLTHHVLMGVHSQPRNTRESV